MNIKGYVLRVVFTGLILFGIRYAGAQVPGLSQQIISGTIVEEGTGKPIRNVSVFFDGTMNGSTTDSTGNFTLYPQGNVKYPILISGVGYYSKTITDYSFGTKLVVDLKVRAYDLDAVTVKADDGMSRKEKLRIFRREFLGSSPNAKSCTILNEDDIRFTYSPQTRILKATCDKPLIVHNKNLGYTLNFILSNFTYTGKQTIVLGSQFFKEDASLAEVERVKKARKNVYLGSQLHFVRSLWENKLAQNGFEAIRYLQKDSSSAGTDRNYVDRDLRRLPYDSLVLIRDNQKYLRFNGLVKITYRTQISMMEANGQPVSIGNNGYIDPAGIVWTGVIGMQRAGDLLPLEFDAEAYSVDQKDGDGNMAGGFIVSAPLDTLHSRMPFEKLYIHLDKPYYSLGDTLRMKAYLLDAADGKGSEKSGIVYVELANDTNQVFIRRMLPVGFGLGTGNIILNKKDIPEGSYTLRAYTNLMRNFGNEISFSRNLYISSATAQSLLVNSKATLARKLDKDNVQLALQFNRMDRQPLRRRELEIRVLDGDRLMQRGKIYTDIDGKMNANFNLPANVNTRNLSLAVTDALAPDYKATIPVEVSRPLNIDLQFMPEGGNLVNGIESRVGFKAIGEDGNAIDVSGKVYNSNNEEVASFSSSYKGMGSFEFKPAGSAVYVAKLMVDGVSKTFPFPVIKNAGSVLRIANTAESDSITATITVSAGLAKSAPYHLVGQSGGKVFYEENIIFKGNTSVRLGIRKDLFPSGVVRFTLMNSDKQPLNERITFIDNHDNLQISLKTTQASYKTRDSIRVAVEVKDSEGRPVEGSFSMAVTDDSQVRTDSLNVSILSSMLLTSGLKGTVEEPGHYLQQGAKQHDDLDNLLLTQGWVGYDWKDVFYPPASPAYKPESEFVLTGRVNNVFNKTAPGSTIQLLSLKPQAAKVGITENDGSFVFKDLPVGDDLKFFLRAMNSKGKSFNVGIEVNEFKPAEFSPSARHVLPWYVNSDTALLSQANTQAAREKNLMRRGTNLLQEVTITKKKAVMDSRNLNGAGEADQILDEADMAKNPRKSLLNLMQERVEGFNVGLWPSRNIPRVGITSSIVKGSSGGGEAIPIPSVSGPGGMGTEPKSILGTAPLFFEKFLSYKIFDKEMHLIIDGVDVESFYFPDPGVPNSTTDKQLALQRTVNPSGNYILERNAADPDERLKYIRLYLDGILAEDIKGIEVMSDPKFNSRYKSRYASNALPSLSPAGPDFAFVEVTTYSGNGAYLKTPPGVFLYKPLSYVNNAAFYKPKYVSKSNALTDLRSSIHWEPDIVTDKDGKATVSFYSADRPGTYSIIMEGSNMNGAVGRKAETISIK